MPFWGKKKGACHGEQPRAANAANADVDMEFGTNIRSVNFQEGLCRRLFLLKDRTHLTFPCAGAFGLSLVEICPGFIAVKNFERDPKSGLMCAAELSGKVKYFDILVKVGSSRVLGMSLADMVKLIKKTPRPLTIQCLLWESHPTSIKVFALYLTNGYSSLRSYTGS